MNRWTSSKKKINLQLFAEPEGQEGGADGKGSEGAEQPAGSNDGSGAAGAEKMYSESELESIVQQRIKDEQEKAAKAKTEAERLAQMNAQERAEYERDQLQQKLDELEKERAVAQMTSTARKMLADANINVSDDIVSLLVSDDAGKTKAAVDSFVSLFNQSVQNAVKDALKGNPPKAGNAATVTKEQIMAIKDPIARQNAIRENFELFR